MKNMKLVIEEKKASSTEYNFNNYIKIIEKLDTSKYIY